jgi:phosphoglycolate phosphatase-like HAD superfamily hydrolase
MKIIFDVDGTLMNVEHRRRFVDGSQQIDWPMFEAETVNDTRNEHIFEIAENMHDAGHSIVIVSARKERQRELTEKQLSATMGVFWDFMFMRPDDSYEPDHEFKQRVLDELIKADWKPDMVFDDRNQVVDMWRRNGIPCLQVAPGDF